MAKRRPGGQPGNKNAKGHRGANRYSAGATPASARQALARSVSRANRPTYSLGTKIKGAIRGHALHAKRNRRAFAKSALKTTAQAAAIATVVTVALSPPKVH